MPKGSDTRRQLALKVASLTDSEIGEVLDYISLIEPARKTTAIPAVSDDDWITTLLDARENKRARQAFAWESVRRRAERQPQLSGARRT